ncbi:MAG: TRAP transporter small permease [Syntrophales bacterium]|nr:TRAP transporter small permease [Syntrophales bacterium]
MSPVKNKALRIIDGLAEISGYLSGFAILAATLIIVEQVVVRYVWNAATIWQVEIAVYLLIAATFLGAPYGLKHHAHINIDMVVYKLPFQLRRRLDIATSFIAMLFCIVLSWRGCVMWWEAWEGNWLSSSLLSTPLIYPYAIIPVGMILTSLQYVIKIMELVKKRHT